MGLLDDIQKAIPDEPEPDQGTDEGKDQGNDTTGTGDSTPPSGEKRMHEYCDDFKETFGERKS